MKGKVYLVGAGPGNQGLITTRGLELIQKADVLVYDRLAGSTLVAEAPNGCKKIYVGKQSSNHAMKQEDINQLLVDLSETYETVVRLKGGDPYVFGRGGEEAIKLYEHNIEFEVVPGITSPIGGLCYAGIPITHRDYASSFHVITGHLKDDNEEHDWDALARLNGTLVFLMGMANLNKITKRLIENGKPEDTPVGIVHWASHPQQKVVEGTLENIVQEVEKSGVTSPSLIVVGDVVKLRKPLNFFERKPLQGKRIIVTRASNQSSTMIKRLHEKGGMAIALPMIEINDLKPTDANKVLKDLDSYTYIVFTSVNGIRRFFQELYDAGLDSRALKGPKIVCVGIPTKEALKKHGIIADLIPKRFVAEGILELLEPCLLATDRVLVPRAKGARPLLIEELSKKCNVEEMQLYETVGADSDWSTYASMTDDIDFITFTSASTVNYFIEGSNKNKMTFKNAKYISIGPVTSEKMRACGMEVYREAEVHTIDGMIETLEKCVEESHNEVNTSS